MYQNVNFCKFQDAFHSMHRANNFTYEGLRALFDYLEQYEDDCATRIELDVVSFCCDYTEESLIDALDNYSLESIEDLKENTEVINYDVDTGLVLYRAF